MKNSFLIINDRRNAVFVSKGVYLKVMGKRSINYDKARRERLLYFPAPQKSYEEILKEKCLDADFWIEVRNNKNSLIKNTYNIKRHGSTIKYSNFNF